MAKTRLNNDDRAVIAKAIIDHKYAPLIDANRRIETELAQAIYNRLYPPDLRRKMKALPDGAFKKVSDITVAVNGQRFTLSFSPATHDELGYNPAVARENCDLRPVLYRHADRSYNAMPPLLLTDADELGTALVEWRRERDSLKAAPGEMRAKVDATLANFRYFDDLLSEFPQAQVFIMRRWHERPDGGSPGVPAVVLRDLARELDLPPETREAA